MGSSIKVKSNVFQNFFLLKSSNGILVKPMFSEGPSIFVLSVCNEGALNLRLKMAALPASSDHSVNSQNYIKVEQVRS